MLQVIDNNLLGYCRFGPDFIEPPLLVELQYAIKVFFNGVGLKALDIKNVVVTLIVSAYDHDTRIIRFRGQRKSKVNGGNNV